VKTLGVIPARQGSQRLPGKPLARIHDRPLVEWVYRAASTFPGFARTIVATDSDEIAELVNGFGGEVELTASGHRTGTDRVAEVAGGHPEYDVVVNVQGDQPFLAHAQLERLLEPFARGDDPEMTTLACPLAGDPDDPNLVKVVCGIDDAALYFSRSRIPYATVDADVDYLHHLGLYAFRRDVLLRYCGLQPTPLEEFERLEQLRALAHGIRIVVCLTDRPVLEVNTPVDLERARELASEIPA
jgi:3-deoxy-manno-octulosonate cytidylyltransferase (CMP-KDO synthetase)